MAVITGNDNDAPTCRRRRDWSGAVHGGRRRYPPARRWQAVWVIVVAAGSGQPLRRPPSSTSRSPGGGSSTGRSTRPAPSPTAWSLVVAADRAPATAEPGADAVVAGRRHPLGARCGPAWPPCRRRRGRRGARRRPARWPAPALFARGGRRRARPAPTPPCPAVPVTDTLAAPRRRGAVDRDGARRGADAAGVPGRRPARAPTPRGAEATDDAVAGRGGGWQGGRRARRARQPQDHPTRRPGGGRGAAPVRARLGRRRERSRCRAAGRPGLRRPPVLRRPGRAARARRRRVRRRAGAWPATATPTSIAHAVTDALLGAAGLGDIGQHFPDTDPALGRRRQRSACWPRRSPTCGPPGWEPRQRRLHGGARGAEAGAPPATPCRPGCPTRSARRSP